MIRILTGDCRDVLPTLEAGSVQTCVTSPPYFGLRSYLPNGHDDKHRELGAESTVDAYVAELVAVFREVRRVLRDDGTCWINLGDSYNAYNGNRGPANGANKNHHAVMPSLPTGHGLTTPTLKPKDLIGIPWRVAFALQEDGWYLRQDIVWSKPNPMPESVRDRCTKSHEYLFLLSKQPRYYYDAAAIAEPATHAGETRNGNGTSKDFDPILQHTLPRGTRVIASNRNRRSVWTISTQPMKDAHFATYPEALVEPCILAGTSEWGQCRACGAPWVRVVETESRPNWMPDHNVQKHDGTHYRPNIGGGVGNDRRTKTEKGWEASCTCDAGPPVPQTVLDPFAGSGTTLRVATRLNRHGIGIELNPEYIPLIEKRTAQRGLEVA